MKLLKSGALLVAVCLAMFLAGCGGREAALTGTWKLNPQSMPQMPAAMANNPMAQNMAKMMGNISLDLRADKTFTLNMGAPMEGTWTFDEASGNVALNLTKVAGQAMPANVNSSASPFAFKLDETNKKLTMQTPAGMPAGAAMTLEKQ